MPRIAKVEPAVEIGRRLEPRLEWEGHHLRAASALQDCLVSATHNSNQHGDKTEGTEKRSFHQHLLDVGADRCRPAHDSRSGQRNTASSSALDAPDDLSVTLSRSSHGHCDLIQSARGRREIEALDGPGRDLVAAIPLPDVDRVALVLNTSARKRPFVGTAGPNPRQVAP